MWKYKNSIKNGLQLKGIHHAGLPPASSLWSVQRNLQVQCSRERAVTVDSELATKTGTLHTLNV